MMLRILPLVVALLAGPAVARDDQSPPLVHSIDGLPLGQLPKQQLPASGCAAYLWSDGTTKALVAMASADPAQLRLSIDGAITDLPRTAQQSTGGLGFAGTTTYQTGGVTVRLDMTIQTQRDLTQGAAVPTGTLTLQRPGKDIVVLPVGGLIGCAPAPAGAVQ
jgi:hypothetical protein